LKKKDHEVAQLKGKKKDKHHTCQFNGAGFVAEIGLLGEVLQ